MTAKYIRLSSQDDDCRPGEKPESNSVANQRVLLDSFIDAHPDLAGQRVREFIDDGHTGTNFDRRGAQALFAAVKCGEIDCIVVKDLSRFGRNSLEVGEYLERIFPLLQVRFISVNDGYDSKTKQYGTAGDLDIGVRNLINELYSQNISRNVKIARRQYASRGECVSPYPFYGYVKGTVNRRRLEIDPSAADTVRLIFNLWLEGNSTQHIADLLNERHILSPSMYKRGLGVKRASWSRCRDEIPWTRSSVRTILQNEGYTGKLISLRTTCQEVGSPKKNLLPKEEWIVADGAFEPIIASDTFHRAQGLFRVLSPKDPCKVRNYQSLFTRKLFCGVCGMGLTRKKVSQPYYKCNAPKGPLMERCKNVRVFEDELKERILSELRDRKTAHHNSAENTVDTASLQEQIMALEQKLEKQWTAKKDAFVRLHGGLISQAEYENIREERQRKIQLLCTERKRLCAAAECQGAENITPVQHTDVVSMTEVTREMMDALIQDIHVYEDGQIQIEWKAKLLT